MSTIKAASCEDMLAYAHNTLKRSDTSGQLIICFVYKDRPLMGPVLTANMPTARNQAHWFKTLAPTLHALHREDLTRAVLIAHEPAVGLEAVQRLSPQLRRSLLEHGFTVMTGWVIADGVVDALAHEDLLGIEQGENMPRPFADPRTSNTALHLLFARADTGGTQHLVRTPLNPDRRNTCTPADAFGDEKTDPFVIRLRTAAWHRTVMDRLDELLDPQTAPTVRTALHNASDEQIDELTVGFAVPRWRDLLMLNACYPRMEEANAVGKSLFQCPSEYPADVKRLAALHELLSLLIPQAHKATAVNMMALQAWILYAGGQGRAASQQLESAAALDPDHDLTRLLTHLLAIHPVSNWATQAPKHQR